MKKLILLKEDGIDYIIGVAKASIEPIESRKKVNEEMVKLDEFKELKKAKFDYINSVKDPSKSKIAKKNLMEKQKKLNDALAKKEKDLIVYFPASKNEKIVTKEEFEEYKNLLIDAKREGKIVGLDKKLYLNNKGKKYYTIDKDGITESVIKKYNQKFPDGSIKKLSKTQKEQLKEKKEKDYINSLDQKEKEKEYKIKLKQVYKWANEKIIELEVNGTSESDAKGQIIPKTRSKINKLKILYNIA